MRFHHMAIVTTNLHEAIGFWRDLMGFELNAKLSLPDGPKPGPATFAYPALLDDIYKVRNARSEVAVLTSKEGAMIELIQCMVPVTERTPAENLRYAHTGFHELGLSVDNIDAFFEKVRAAGYDTQTDYIWPCANIGRTFIFYDREGNMIQIWEGLQTGEIAWSPVDGEPAREVPSA
jgi:catechol 2,3-dioxygenase-like lactoylglutathione lyase family enzyme